MFTGENKNKELCYNTAGSSSKRPPGNPRSRRELPTLVLGYENLTVVTNKDLPDHVSDLAHHLLDVLAGFSYYS